ncbi:dimethyladenosine transferase [Erysipelothrix rhusiopathiae SY1027]|nr:dimethyladenosine transferase [Erysipelothrix rhusiopathiae SY1027]
MKTIDKDVDYATVLESLGLETNIRADYLTFDDYIRLYGALYA